MTLSLAVIYGWWFIRLKIWGPPMPAVPATQPVASQPVETVPGQRPAAPTTSPVEQAAGKPQKLAPATQPTIAATGKEITNWQAAGAERVRTVTLGEDKPASRFFLQVFLDNRGGAVSRVRIVARKPNGRYRYEKDVGSDEPYPLLDPLVLPDGREVLSWQTESVRIVGPEISLDLSDLPWKVRTQRSDRVHQAVMWVDLLRDGKPVARLTKTFKLAIGSYELEMQTTIQPLDTEPVKLVVTQLGPVGIHREDPRWDYRKIYAVLKSEDRARPVRWTHGDLVKKGPASLGSDTTPENPLWWLALTNKYFAAITVPVAAVGVEGQVASSQAFAFTKDRKNGGDLAVKMLTPPIVLTPGKTVLLKCELYLGPKDKKVFQSDPRYVARQYVVLRSAEYAWCTFSWLGELMIWLLEKFYQWIPPHNYGIAIICLVILVRAVLHPLTKHQQVNMARLQKKQAVLQPKLEAIKQRYANDKQRMQEEIIKAYQEAGISPTAQLAGCLPMLLQMPIWVALYSALNYDINLRHQPFMLWIKDLSGPDSLLRFQPVSIPIISWFIGPVDRLNVLPILLAGSMYLQQRFMPKPQQQTPRKAGQQDQMAQMQKMMGFMMLIMGLVFYNMPSGLNLYIMASSLFGMAEQWRIRKHIQAETEQGDEPDHRPRQRPPDESGKRLEAWLKKIEKKTRHSRTVRKGR